ncbi:hypothetical protein LPMP_221510 [Leishmania panamensis]|uniref:Uncharacterized protein n=1 Tax=Leishmania panamensis TaxID=5679 RepID=A0A088RRB6_LEIPA|nr:hypothetical protein LPMP_221510 [Leishmania panamensis]AIN98445.1 hypothetical protein LPMP_221510 [Leishmania panamensis]
MSCIGAFSAYRTAIAAHLPFPYLGYSHAFLGRTREPHSPALGSPCILLLTFLFPNLLRGGPFPLNSPPIPTPEAALTSFLRTSDGVSALLMAVIATLPAASWTRLLYICRDVVAACDSKTAYLVQHRGDTRVDEATCTSPCEADHFVPWLPLGVPVAGVRTVWCMRKGQSNVVFAEPAGEACGTAATSPDTAAIEIISGLADNIISMHIFYQSVLAVRTLKRVLFYSLDPSPSATTIATQIGACALPKWVNQPAVVVDIASPSCCCATAEKTICVACFTLGRMFVATVVCPSSTSAVVVRRTAMSGVLFSSSGVPDPAAMRVCKWAVRWSRQEMIMLCFSEVDKISRLTGFFLQPTRGCEMSKWMSPEELAASVSGASAAVVGASRDMCSDSDGAHVWLCDTSTGPSVILREVTAASPNEVVLADTNASLRVAMAAGISGVFVLSGCTLYAVKSGHTGTVSAGTAGRAITAAAGDLSREQERRVQKEPPAAEAITTKAAASERFSLSAPTPSTPLQPAAFTATTAASLPRSAHIKDAVLQYVSGDAPIFSYIVRDAVYVHESGSATSGMTFTHDILSRINARFDADRHQHALACIRYATVALSLHPYTVLELLRFRRRSSVEVAPEGLLLAIASTLADKPTLQHGGLRRLPAFDTASTTFFASTGGGGPFTSELEKKRYVADVCGAAKAALANGALGATRLLFTVAARAVSLIYGGTRKRHVGATQSYGEEERMCEVVIAECISLIRSYVEWSLTTSSSLGVMSAHVGSPHTLTKEAALRDGEAHFIDTSRQVQIHPMQVSRQPKRSI